MIKINARIVAEARSFLNTPFHIQGRKKGVGIDCIGLIIGVADSFKFVSKQGGLIKDYDFQNYSIYDSKGYLPNCLNLHLEETTSLVIGNIALFKNEQDLFHLGIIGDYGDESFSLIHACMGSEKVVEHRLTQELKTKIIKYYQFYTN